MIILSKYSAPNAIGILNKGYLKATFRIEMHVEYINICVCLFIHSEKFIIFYFCLPKL